MNEQVTFLPFHAINEFMRDDFRMAIIRSVLNDFPDLSDKTQTMINRHTNKSVKIPGFRNPAKAPSTLKIVPTLKAFEKSPELVAAILSAWSERRPELRDKVFELLKMRNWSFLSEKFDVDDILNDWRILPINADRTKLPGFYSIWPKGENFETLYEAFMKVYPESEDSIDSVSLMVVWITMRLPYHVEDEPNLEQD